MRSLKILFLFLSLSLFSSLAAAQFTLVTATVVDPNGHPYALGNVSAQVITAGVTPTLNGLGFSMSSGPANLDATGSFTMSLVSSTAMVPNLQWQFTVCSGIGTVLPAGGVGPVCFTSLVTITGATQNISATLSAAAPPISNPASLAGAVLTNPPGSQTIQGPTGNSTLFLEGPLATGSLALEIDNQFSAGITVFSHSNTGFRGPVINTGRSEGTQAAPTVVNAADVLGYYQALGFNGTGYVSGGTFECFAQQTWSVANNGTYCQLYSTPTNTASPVASLTLGSTVGGSGVGIQNANAAAEFTLQTNAGGRMAFGTPNAALVADADLLTSQTSFYVNESTLNFLGRIKFNAGTLHTLTLPIDTPAAGVITATSAAFATATVATTCVQNTTAVTGATTAMAVAVSPVSTPGVGAVWSAFVSSAGNVTITECAVATSAGGTIAFNIRVFL